ncbi:MAG: DoxX family protein [Deltaproteobacteria bacterium]|nr:DoxX family protein [Deltaproteobacteria bacterium]
MTQSNLPSNDTVDRRLLWAGRVLSALAALGLTGSALGKLTGAPALRAMMSGKFGFDAAILPKLGVLELVCVLVYVIPQTSVLGAILLTGYLGGATVTHVRVDDPFVAPIVIGAVAWLGLWLREPRLRALLPLRRSD